MRIVDRVDDSFEVASDAPLWFEYATTLQRAARPEMAPGDKATAAKMPLQESDDFEEIGSDYPQWESS